MTAPRYHQIVPHAVRARVRLYAELYALTVVYVWRHRWENHAKR